MQDTWPNTSREERKKVQRLLESEAKARDETFKQSAQKAIGALRLRKCKGEEWSKLSLTEHRRVVGLLSARGEKYPNLNRVLKSAVRRLCKKRVEHNAVSHAIEAEPPSTEQTGSEDPSSAN